MTAGVSVARGDLMRTHLLGLVVVGIAARAGADPLVVAEPVGTADPTSTAAVDVGEPPLTDRSGLPDHALHFDFGCGADLGHLDAGNMTANAGLHALFGPRLGRVAVLAEADLAATQSPDGSTLGMYERVALEARVSLWQVRGREFRFNDPPTELVRREVWIEPGIGYETASQQDMPTLGRRDLAFSIGYQTTHHYESHTFGAYAALRVMEADPAPGERSRDLSLLFTSGVLLGH
jgi:hypothetical protein